VATRWSPAHWGNRLGRDAIYLSVLLRHQAPRRVSRPVRIMLAAARAFGRVRDPYAAAPTRAGS
jgi:hypothetical protein